MKKKSIVLLIIIFAFISVGIVSFGILATAKSDNGVRPLEEMAMMDLTHKNFADKEAKALEIEPIGSPIVQPAEEGDEYPFFVSDDYLGIDYLENFTVLLEGDHILLLITTDAYNSFDGTYYKFENPNGDDSEPWLRTWDYISHEQLVYLKDEFDNNIYDRMADVYGVPNSRPTDPSDPDYEECDKIWTLIFNIRDDAYYNPDAVSYIVGYFSLADSNFYQKNIMHIDTYDWVNRIGPGVARPYLYEGSFCHEYEHMIHADIDPDEPSWVDEGLADLAAYFCGYGHMSGHIANYLVYHPYTSLIFWGGGLEDYGVSYLFQLYLYEKFGGEEFTSALVANPLNGIEGIESTLAAFDYDETFNEIFDAWTIANYVDLPNHPIYGYDTLEFGTIDTWGYSIRYALDNFWLGKHGLKAPVAYMSPFGKPLPYTATYFLFGGQPSIDVYLEGDILAGPGPHSGDWAWWSDVNAWAWRSFYKTNLEIPTEGATLNFWTFFEIEWNWDYGYVEVYDQDNDTWTTLYDPAVVMYDDYGDPYGMVDFVGHPQDNPYCLVGREPTDYLPDKWHAFSGYSNGWIPVSMDLTAFAGDTIDLYFTTWQDGAFTLQMMYVDDIEITNGVLPLDHVESDPGSWLSTGWYVFSCFETNNWQGTVIETFWEPTKRYPPGNSLHLDIRGLDYIINMDMFTGTSWYRGFDVQYGWITGLPANPASSRSSLVFIVSNRADHILPADYFIAFL